MARRTVWPEPPADDLMPLTPSLRLPVALLAALVLLAGCRAADAGRSVSGSLAAPVAPTTTTTSTTTVAPTTTVPELVFVAHRPVVKPDEVDRPAPTPTLRNLIRTYLEPEDHDWAEKVAFCESSAQPDDVFSFAVNKSSRAAGWFQHLPKFWEERTEAAGIPGASIADPVAQLKVAAYLLYETPQGRGHWMQSQACWG
ncbi:MAG: hypothetical protein QF575_09695 [Acidimicrobiales bacterium]|nr:hypothetical protein [Acidimicrobiales bacterium]